MKIAILFRKSIPVFIITALLFSQLGSLSAQEQPTIAYKILNNYIENDALEQYKNGKTASTAVTIVGGGLMLGGLALTAWGAPLFSDYDTTWTADTIRYTVGGSVAGVGAIMGIAGLIGMNAEMPDLKAKYYLVYQEEDLVLREALAAATLKTMAQNAKSYRVVSSIIGISVPVLTFGVSMLSDSMNGKNPWDTLPTRLSAGFSGTLISGITGLATKSEFEKLYDQYLTARASLYSVPNGKE